MLRAFNEAFLAAGPQPGEAEASARAAALMRELDARVFQDRLLAHPVLFDETDLAILGKMATRVLGAQVKLLQHLRTAAASDAALLAAFAMPPALAPLLRWDNLERPDETIARLDLVPTATSYKLCELNVFPGVGGGEAYRAMAPAFPTAPCPLRTLADTYVAQCRRHGLGRVVILDSVAHGAAGYPRQLLLQRYLADAGLEVHLHDDASYPTAWLAPGEGARTLIHRLFTYEELADVAFAERLWASGARLAGFESELRMSKRFLALLFEHLARFDSDEVAAIAAYVPTTHALDDDRLDHALRNRGDYVFKLTDAASYGGAGVLIGGDHTAEALEAQLRAAGVDRWIVQEALEAETLPLRTPGDPTPAAYRIVLGLYSYGGTPSGMLLRGSRASRVVNVSNAAGRLGWAFPVSDETRRKLERPSEQS